MVSRRAKFQCGFMTGLLACLVYVSVLTLNDQSFAKISRIPQRIGAWFTAKVEPWESAMPGDKSACVKMVQLLAKPTEDTMLNFTWPTTDFGTIFTNLNHSHGLETELCNRYDDKSRYHSDSGIAQPRLTVAEASYFITKFDRASLGDHVRIFIVTRNSDYQRTVDPTGGDFFKVRLENPYTKSSVAASEVRYQGNGTYVADVKLLWSGRLFVRVLFAQSAYFVEAVKRLTAQERPSGSRFEGSFGHKYFSHSLGNVLNDGTPTQRTECQLTPPQARGRSVCNFTNQNGETWYCDAPKPPLTCSDWQSSYTKRTLSALELFEIFPEDDRGSTVRTTLKGRERSIDVPPDGKFTEIDRSKLPSCKPMLDTSPSPAGFWYYGEWKSNVCRNRHFFNNPERLKQCLKGRTFYFLGDSTIRQWYEFFVKDGGHADQWGNSIKFHELEAFDDVWDPQTAVAKDLNLTLHYRCHGPPLQNGGKRSSMRYVSNELDDIPRIEGQSLTVAIAVGPHFLLYNPNVYLKRLTIIKQAALRLLERNPQATVLIKGPGTFDRGIGMGECCLSDWLAYRQHKLASGLFTRSQVTYLDVWDMTLSHLSPDLIHPERKVVQSQLDMALSFSCLSAS